MSTSPTVMKLSRPSLPRSKPNVFNKYANLLAPIAVDAVLAGRNIRVGADLLLLLFLLTVLLDKKAPDSNGDTTKATEDANANDGSDDNGGSIALLKNIGDNMTLDASNAPNRTVHDAQTNAHNEFVELNIISGNSMWFGEQSMVLRQYIGSFVIRVPVEPAPAPPLASQLRHWPS